MVETLLLLGCALVPGQALDRVPPSRGGPPVEERRNTGDWFLAPRLLRSQELVYHGSYNEDSDSAGVHFSRAYHMDLRLFVLDVTQHGPEVAFLTTWRLRDTPSQAGRDAPPNSVRLEVAQVDLLGKVAPPAGVRLQVPLDAIPTAEWGVFVETPDRRLGVNDSWEVGEDGRPPTLWHVIGMEQVNGTGCVKLVGVQQSEDWDKPRADRASWRRTDSVWMSTRLGVAVRVERLIECREAARREVSWKSTLQYDLESSMQFPGALSDDRRQEIARARTLAQTAAPLMAAPTKSPTELATLLSKISFVLENTPSTPYRDAVLQVRRRLEAARRGEVVASMPGDTLTRPSVANVGEMAPDFVAPDIITHESARLQRWRGKPILLVFYHPASVNAAELLRFGQRLQTTYAARMTVIGLAVTDEVDKVPQQRAELGLTFPLLKGNGLRISYALEATPKLVLVDPNGFVRGTWTGWGGDIADEVLQEMRRWLPPEVDKGAPPTLLSPERSGRFLPFGRIGKLSTVGGPVSWETRFKFCSALRKVDTIGWHDASLILTVNGFTLMTDYDLGTKTRRCCETGRELQPGEKYFSVLTDEGGKLVRRDYAAEVWKGPPDAAFSFWSGRVANTTERRRPQMDDELLFDCFVRLEEETEAARVRFRYVLALLLMRRRRLRFEEAEMDGLLEVLVLRCSRTGARHRVVNPGLTEEELVGVQEDVFQALGWD